MRKYVSDTKPELVEEAGKKYVELGKDHYDHFNRFYVELTDGEEIEVVTRRIYWGPDGHASPVSVYKVRREGDNIAITCLRDATEEDLRQKFWNG